MEMKQVTRHIDIDATPDQVWAILEDLDRWSEWNPFVIEASGDVRVGARLRVRIQLPGRKPSVFKPRVTEAAPGSVFEWLGRMGIPGVFDGRHRFELEPIDSGTRFHQSERFTGMLAGLLMRFIGGSTLAGFEAMNAALKERAESTARPA
jgi:hypothetical protein